jgi:hypothetical protein
MTAALALGAPLAACGSSSKPTPTGAQLRRQTCRRVEGVLSNGPDPEADSIGYAQAQILPLGEIHSSDAKLAAAIHTLAHAYRAFSQSNSSSSAKTAVNTATKTIEALCHGVAL